MTNSDAVVTPAAIAAEAPAFSIGRIIRLTFSVLSRRFPYFFGFAFLVLLPEQFIKTSVLGITTASFAQGLWLNRWPALVPFMFLAVTAGYVIRAVITHGTLTQLNGQPARMGDALARTIKVFLPLMLIAVVYTVAVGLGFVALIFPGVMLLTTFSVIVPVRLMENTEVLDTFGRSAELTQGYRWPIFGLFIILGLVGVVARLVEGPVLKLSLAVHLAGQPLLYDAVSGLVEAVLSVLSATAVACLYFTLREAKEGVGPDRLAAIFE